MACPICGSKVDITEIEKGADTYVKCIDCKQVRRKNIVNVEKYTNDDSYRDFMFRESQMYEDFEQKILYIKKIKKTGKLLDVGCSYGILMKVAQDYGYEVDGIEPSVSCVKYAKNRYGFNVKQGILDQPTAKKYDIIVMNHVLEHTTNPLETLSCARRSLNDGGIILVAFPNYGSEEAQKQKGEWRYLMAGGHNFQFTLDTISNCLINAGFDVIYNPELTSNLVVIGRVASQGTIPAKIIKRFDREHVDVILPVHNNWSLTKEFLERFMQTTDHPFNLIIVNDASTDNTEEEIKKLINSDINYKNATYIKNESNLGFLASVNKGIAFGKNDFILIANNDIRFLSKGWLSTMVNTLRQFPDLGAVGIEYLHNCVDFVSMCLFMTRRKIIDKIGVLDERYMPAVFEDVDFCMRLQLNGYRVSAVQIPAVHLRKDGIQGGKDKTELTSINKEKFELKYKDILQKKREKKIAFHIVNQLWCGGIEEDIKNLVKYKRQDWEIWVAAPQDGIMSKEILQYGGKVFIGNSNRIFALMNVLKPDLVHTHTNGPLTQPNSLANALYPKPVRIETIHSPGVSNATEDRLDCLVAVSQDTFERQYFPKTELIYNGVDFDKCCPNKITISPRFKTVIGKISRIAPDKKIADFILAAYRLSQKYKDSTHELEFHLVGEDSTKTFKDICKLFVENLGLTNFKFFPETRDMKILNLWDIALAPTSVEGFGLVTAEMMAMDMPVITYDSFANREIVQDGRNGFLVEPDDIDGLVEKTAKVIDDVALRRTLAENGLKDVKKFDATKMAEQYYDLYERLLKNANDRSQDL